jgi:dynein heavy chain, axonemal
LESIFASQEKESEKQLVGDISKFQAVNQRLSYHMNRLFEDKNVKRALCVEGFLSDLNDMSRKLDDSQKILYQLLERQRKSFPRFYFLSNDDLFELLGNSKDVYKVNKHIKKCFEGIKKFEILTLTIPSGRGKSDVYEVAAMISPEGESVKFSPKVLCDSQLEKWL